MTDTLIAHSNSFVHDPAYQERISDALLEALVLTTKDKDTGVAIWRSGDILHVLTLIQAMVVAGSPVVSSPTKLREFCQEHGKKLQRLIRETQDHDARQGSTFPHVVVEGLAH